MHASTASFLRRVVLLCVLVVPMLSSIVLPTSTARQTQHAETLTPVDHELRLALIDVELLDVWVETSGLSMAASMATVTAGGSYDTARGDLIEGLAQLAERRESIDARKVRLASLTKYVETLDTVIRDLRRDVTAAGRISAVSLAPQSVEQARLALESVTTSNRWVGISLDPLTLAEHRLDDARDDLVRQVDQLARSAARGVKSHDEAVARFTLIQVDLQRVQHLIATTAQRSIAAEFEYAAHESAVVDRMAALHDARRLGTTAVGGLSTVTLDAYVRAAAPLDPACPVDWALLAGIGRVESRHGTIGGATVQWSGRVSNSILGPLLDGGATEREAAQAAAAAEAALLAEAEAEAAAQAALEDAEPTFDESVWGEATLDRARELAEATQSPDPVGRAAPPAVEEPVVTPRYDPLLWGDDLPFDEADLAPLDQAEAESDVEEDAEEPEFRGNGFAVIHDSDNGRLDGNSRWDRAVGPMQFLPETWSYWATDGNGDGVMDPQNLYDAAASAGRFLCHLSGTRGPSPQAFVLGYNSSDTYVRNVLAVADTFRSHDLAGLGR